MLEFLIDNIYVVVAEQVFQQSVEIPMGTNLLADLFLYTFEEFIQKLQNVLFYIHVSTTFLSTVNPRYNGHVSFQRFCHYNESAVVTIYLHYEVSHIRAIIF
jgi:hypothetical protein